MGPNTASGGSRRSRGARSRTPGRLQCDPAAGSLLAARSDLSTRPGFSLGGKIASYASPSSGRSLRRCGLKDRTDSSTRQGSCSVHGRTQRSQDERSLQQVPMKLDHVCRVGTRSVATIRLTSSGTPCSSPDVAFDIGERRSKKPQAFWVAAVPDFARAHPGYA
jgi:hypothetical protein